MSVAGSQYKAPDQAELMKRLRAADKPGEHLWAMVACWQMLDPAAHRDGEFMMDRENLIGLNGPGCFKCEKPYSAKMSKRPCRGSVDDPYDP